MMQAFTAALGGARGPPRPGRGAGRRAGDGGGGRGGRGGGAPAFDYASDDKPQKKAARQMMPTVRDINPKWSRRSARPRR